ncbi:MAG TPA: metal ABC transporter permease [Verrucomicrobiae bacterium]|nr:metal ABC transporter permease [Verrucomicrobiae bacterium]
MNLPLQLNSFFEYGFLARALLAGMLLSVTCGLLSPFVVLRRLSFSADGLAHASLGGLALGIVILNTGLTPSLGVYVISLIFTFAVAAGMAWFGGAQRVASDTAIGACYVAAFAFGALLLCAKKRFSAHLEHFFFGNILAVTAWDCWLLGLLALATAAFCFTHWRWLGQWTFDEELARAAGVPVTRLRYTLILLIAATVILSVKVVGLLLVTAMLILPGATGTLMGRGLWSIVVAAVTTAMGCALAGLVASNAADAPPGPAIVLAAFTVFAAAFVVRQKVERRRAGETARAS